MIKVKGELGVTFNGPGQVIYEVLTSERIANQGCYELRVNESLFRNAEGNGYGFNDNSCTSQPKNHGILEFLAEFIIDIGLKIPLLDVDIVYPPDGFNQFDTDTLQGGLNSFLPL